MGKKKIQGFDNDFQETKTLSYKNFSGELLPRERISVFIVGREECDQFNENRKLLVIVTFTGRSRAQPDRRGGILVNSAVCIEY